MKHVELGMLVDIKGKSGIVSGIIDGRHDPDLESTLYYEVDITKPEKLADTTVTVRLDEIRRSRWSKKKTT